MSVFPIVFGVKLRATKINNCGMPIAGAANRLVTSGFVRVTMTKVMRDANDIEQVSADGKVCVTARTPATRKYYTPEIELCNVNTGLISMLTGYEQVVDYDGASVGFRDQANVSSDYGVAFEVWTGGRAEEDCPVPTTDTVLAGGATGKSYGYLLFGAVEFTLGDIVVNNDVSTLTASGMTVTMSQWGRGPYNVVPIDSSNTPGRLLDPFSKDPHLHFQRTTIAPPEDTAGSEPEALAVASIFTGSNYYYGGPNSAPGVDVAPAQPGGGS